jgi:alpha-mannosidase
MSMRRRGSRLPHSLSRILLLIGVLAGGGAAVAAASTPDSNVWVAGYDRTLAGETIRYHSSHPLAQSALIVRAETGDQYIEWQTAPVPDTSGISTVSFAWLAGLATGKGGHSFELSVDGRPVLTLSTTADAAAKRREFFGPDGSRLVFQAALTDQFEELFGPMILTLPASACPAGHPLTIRIRGPAADSRDWIMTFRYKLRNRTSAEPEQVLLRQEPAPVQLVRVDVERLGPPVEAEVSLARASKLRAVVEPGFTALYLPVPAVTAPLGVRLGVRLGREPAASIPLRLEPVVRRELYLLPHSHNDIGYSDLQVKVERDQWRYLGEGIALARKTADYPPEARFKWNVEILWPLRSYLAQAGEAGRREFVEAVRNGWVGLEAPLANELTGLCSPEELVHLTDYARRLVEECGLPPLVTGMISDIPGSIWSLVPALALAGVKYFSSGPNYVPFYTDGGDRIGFTSRAWGDKPFYWVSASGRCRILFWMAGRGYSWFHGLNQGNLGRSGERPIFDYVRELAAEGYPYDMIQVRYTVGGDNGPPDPLLSDQVRAWNEKFVSPRLVIATSRQMFEEFERRHGDSLPSFRGDMTPYWEDGAMSSARETVLNRRAVDRLLQAETLWAMLAPAACPLEDIDRGWRQALLYDEHTWGAANSVSEPDAPEVKTQWDYKKAFALEADRLSREMLDRALRGSGRVAEAATGPRGQAIEVFNTSSWPRTGLILVPARLSRLGDRAVDDGGRPVPSQRFSTGELALLARNVPGLGSKRYLIGPGGAWSEGAVRAEGNVLENDSLRLTVDRASGAVSSLVWKGRDIEFVDGRRGLGLNDYFYVPGRDPRDARRNLQPRITVKESGPLVGSLLVESEAPGCRLLSRELRLVQGLDHLEIENTLDKKAVRTKESAHFAFPVLSPGGTMRYDTGWGVVRPGADQLAGACLDYLSVQNWVDVSGPDSGLTWASPDAPLVEPGTMTDETLTAGGTRSWKERIEPGTTFFSYAMNNYWHTNYRADQEGLVAFRYGLRPHGVFDAAAAKRFGIEFAQPLLVAPAGRGTTPAPLLRVSPASVIVTSARPSRDGKALILRLYEAAGRPDTVSLETPGFEGAAIFLSSPAEEAGKRLTGSFDFPAFGVITLRLER